MKKYCLIPTGTLKFVFDEKDISFYECAEPSIQEMIDKRNILVWHQQNNKCKINSNIQSEINKLETQIRLEKNVKNIPDYFLFEILSKEEELYIVKEVISNAKFWVHDNIVALCMINKNRALDYLETLSKKEIGYSMVEMRNIGNKTLTKRK